MNIYKFISIAVFASGVLFSGTLAGEVTGTVSTGVSTGTSGVVIAPPLLTPTPGTYSSSQTISFDLQGAVYSCFTTNNSNPSCDWNNLTCTNGTKYSGTLSVASTQTIKTISCYAGGNVSQVGVNTYTISLPSSGGGGGGGGYTPPSPTQTPHTNPVPTPENSGSGIDSCSGYFIDTKDHWAKKYICFLKKRGIVNGKNIKKISENKAPLKDVKFFPEDEITRAEVVKIAVLGFSLPEVSSTETKRKIFSDISKDDWFYSYVARAKNAKIINGRKNGEFDPNTSITRAEAVKILLLSAKVKIISGDDNTEKKFSDVPDYAWYYNLVYTAKKLGIIDGKADGKFHPDDKITRAEFSKITALLLDK